jgi:SOS-response transcriptional repressor LexA
MTTRERVFIAILKFWRENAIPPVIRDLMKEVGLKSTSAVRFHIYALEKDKRLRMIRSHPVPTEIEKLIKGEFPQ